MVDFAKLKKNRNDTLNKITAELSKLEQNFSRDDNADEFWKPEVDKAGNGYAVIRFLPAPENEEMPFVRYWDHGFKGPTGKWYIEKSLTTLGKDDPVAEMNSKLWATELEANKNIVRERKRRLHYVSNIYVVKDPAHPENEGKVFKFVYGKKIFDKLKDIMHPQFEDEKPINPFDFWEGADFKLKIRKVEGYRNYDKSEFDRPSPLAKDSELEVIYGKLYSLASIVDPAQFKSYDELKRKLNEVLGNTMGAVPEEAKAEAKQQKAEPAPWEETKTSSFEGDEDEDDLAFFEKLSK